MKLISKAASSQVNLRPSSGADIVRTTLTPGVFHEIQFRLLVGTAGQSEVWLDGVRVAQLSTRNFGTGLIGGISIGERQTGRTSDVAYDDVIVDSEQIM